MLRRPNVRRRDVRRRASRAPSVADPDQDRQLMSAFPPSLAPQRRSSSPPPARRRRQTLRARGPQTLSDRARRAEPSMPLPEQARRSPANRPKPPLPLVPDPAAAAPRSSNPHRSLQRKQRPSCPRFPPREAFERRPQLQPRRHKGVGVRNPRMRVGKSTIFLVLVNSDFSLHGPEPPPKRRHNKQNALHAIASHAP